MEGLIVGLDLGFRHTGVVAARPSPFGVGYDIVDFLCINTQPEHKKRGTYVSHDDIRSCQEMTRDLGAFINKVGKVSCIIAEMPPGGGKGARAVRAMGIATGMLAAIVEMQGYPAHWVMPDESKKLVGGKKNASKEEMMDAVRGMFPDVVWPKAKCTFEHIADAVAALIVGKRCDIYKLMVQETSNA